MARGRDQPDAISFRVIHRTERGRDLDFAAVAGAGVDMANLDRSGHRQKGLHHAVGAGSTGIGGWHRFRLRDSADPADLMNKSTPPRV